MKSTGFRDKNGEELFVGDICRTFDRKGGEWVAPIKHVKDKTIYNNGTDEVFVFASNYDTWLNEKYCSTRLEKLGSEKDTIETLGDFE